VRNKKSGNAKIGRKIENESELLTILQNKLESPIGKKFNVKIVKVDFAHIPYKKQIEYMRETDIYIGT
jgi:hypothetical protein